MLAALFWRPTRSGRLHGSAYGRLSQLVDAGLIDRFRPAVAGGTHEWIYQLAEPGWTAIAGRPDLTGPLPSYGFTQARRTDIRYAEHDLALAGVLVGLGARTVARAGGDPRGQLAGAIPWTWRGEHAGRIDPRHETPAPDGQPLPEGWAVNLQHRAATIMPDATLIGPRADDGRPIVLMIEYDRTRRASRQADKLAAYDAFLTHGWRSSRYAALGVDRLGLLIITQEDRHLIDYARVADHTLTSDIRPAGTPDALAQRPAREGVAITTAARIAAGNWQMLGIDPLPPAVRARAQGNPRAASTSRREQTVDLAGWWRPRTASPSSG